MADKDVEMSEAETGQEFATGIQIAGVINIGDLGAPPRRKRKDRPTAADPNATTAAVNLAIEKAALAHDLLPPPAKKQKIEKVRIKQIDLAEELEESVKKLKADIEKLEVELAQPGIAKSELERLNEDLKLSREALREAQADVARAREEKKQARPAFVSIDIEEAEGADEAIEAAERAEGRDSDDGEADEADFEAELEEARMLKTMADFEKKRREQKAEKVAEASIFRNPNVKPKESKKLGKHEDIEEFLKKREKEIELEKYANNFAYLDAIMRSNGSIKSQVFEFAWSLFNSGNSLTGFGCIDTAVKYNRPVKSTHDVQHIFVATLLKDMPSLTERLEAIFAEKDNQRHSLALGSLIADLAAKTAEFTDTPFVGQNGVSRTRFVVNVLREYDDYEEMETEINPETGERVLRQYLYQKLQRMNLRNSLPEFEFITAEPSNALTIDLVSLQALINGEFGLQTLEGTDNLAYFVLSIPVNLFLKQMLKAIRGTQDQLAVQYYYQTSSKSTNPESDLNKFRNRQKNALKGLVEASRRIHERCYVYAKLLETSKHAYRDRMIVTEQQAFRENYGMPVKYPAYVFIILRFFGSKLLDPIINKDPAIEQFIELEDAFLENMTETLLFPYVGPFEIKESDIRSLKTAQQDSSKSKVTVYNQTEKTLPTFLLSTITKELLQDARDIAFPRVDFAGVGKEGDTSGEELLEVSDAEIVDEVGDEERVAIGEKMDIDNPLPEEGAGTTSKKSTSAKPSTIQMIKTAKEEAQSLMYWKSGLLGPYITKVNARMVREHQQMVAQLRIDQLRRHYRLEEMRRVLNYGVLNNLDEIRDDYLTLLKNAKSQSLQTVNLLTGLGVLVKGHQESLKRLIEKELNASLVPQSETSSSISNPLPNPRDEMKIPYVWEWLEEEALPEEVYVSVIGPHLTLTQHNIEVELAMLKEFYSETLRLFDITASIASKMIETSDLDQEKSESAKFNSDFVDSIILAKKLIEDAFDDYSDIDKNLIAFRERYDSQVGGLPQTFNPLQKGKGRVSPMILNPEEREAYRLKIREEVQLGKKVEAKIKKLKGFYGPGYAARRNILDTNFASLVNSIDSSPSLSKEQRVDLSIDIDREHVRIHRLLLVEPLMDIDKYNKVVIEEFFQNFMLKIDKNYKAPGEDDEKKELSQQIETATREGATTSEPTETDVTRAEWDSDYAERNPTLEFYEAPGLAYPIITKHDYERLLKAELVTVNKMLLLDENGEETKFDANKRGDSEFEVFKHSTEEEKMANTGGVHPISYKIFIVPTSDFIDVVLNTGHTTLSTESSASAYKAYEEFDKIADDQIAKLNAALRELQSFENLVTKIMKGVVEGRIGKEAAPFIDLQKRFLKHAWESLFGATTGSYTKIYEGSKTFSSEISDFSEQIETNEAFLAKIEKLKKLLDQFSMKLGLIRDKKDRPWLKVLAKRPDNFRESAIAFLKSILQAMFKEYRILKNNAAELLFLEIPKIDKLRVDTETVFYQKDDFVEAYHVINDHEKEEQGEFFADFRARSHSFEEFITALNEYLFWEVEQDRTERKVSESEHAKKITALEINWEAKKAEVAKREKASVLPQQRQQQEKPIVDPILGNLTVKQLLRLESDKSFFDLVSLFDFDIAQPYSKLLRYDRVATDLRTRIERLAKIYPWVKVSDDETNYDATYLEYLKLLEENPKEVYTRLTKIIGEETELAENTAKPLFDLERQEKLSDKELEHLAKELRTLEARIEIIKRYDYLNTGKWFDQVSDDDPVIIAYSRALKKRKGVVNRIWVELKLAYPGVVEPELSEEESKKKEGKKKTGRRALVEDGDEMDVEKPTEVIKAPGKVITAEPTTAITTTPAKQPEKPKKPPKPATGKKKASAKPAAASAAAAAVAPPPTQPKQTTKPTHKFKLEPIAFTLPPASK